ncbi:hypothetical protein SeLEV6574_g06587 [Synchytrium endobioticum]|uniref:Uncharacterized protein n=1 Tax=Synchytrium endobioticum TaxID=286115 RepID=A0A507CMZ3_9FUNG|nr:hypothetical protein SeLEV6574_g06587 [Synchytrium endobioticum]
MINFRGAAEERAAAALDSSLGRSERLEEQPTPARSSALVIRYYSKSNERIRQETASAALTDGDAIMEGHCFFSASATGT